MKTMTQKSLLLATLAASSLVLTACGSGSTVDNNDEAPDGLATSQALFRPLSGVLPLPTNLLFAAQPGQPLDGTLNIPSSNPAAIAVSDLDGWSTIAPITIGTNKPIDPASVVAGSSVRLFNVCIEIATGAPTGPGPDLEVPASEYEAVVSSISPTQLLIKPTKPLRPAIDLVPGTGTIDDCNAPDTPPSQRNGYIAIVTSALLTTDGEAFTATNSYKIAQSSDQLYNIEIEDGAVAQVGGEDTATGMSFRTNGVPPARTPAALAAGLTTPTDARTMESVRALTNGVELLAGAIGGVASADIIVSTIFSTQSVGAQLAGLARAATPRANSFTNTGNATPGGRATVHTGTIDLPYYLGMPTADRPTAPLEDPWCVTPIAEQADGSFDCDTPPTLITAGMGFQVNQTATVSVPVTVTVPSGDNAPAAGASMPVVIFQHGIGADRSSLMAIADALAGAGLVAIAIDHPLHGDRSFGPIEGTLAYLNLTDLLVGRDNIRQSVIDIINLAATIPTIQLNTTTDANSPSFSINGGTTYLGHSLGGIVGVPVLALAPPSLIGAATLAMPGSGIGKLLDASSGFGPLVAGNLAQAGAPEGSLNYETFLSFAQQVIDSADPANWASVVNATTADPRRAVHLIEVVGNLESGGTNLPDQTVPNNANEANPPAAGETLVIESGPLGGTDPLIALLGLDIFVADPDAPTSSDSGGAVQFTAGDHASILLPNSDCLTWFEMQTETAIFLASGGDTLPIGSSNVPPMGSTTGTGTATCTALGF